MPQRAKVLPKFVEDIL
jgi:hypothetical protein